MKFAVPVGGELVVGVLPGLADDEGAGLIRGLARGGGDQKAARVAELIALEIEQSDRHRVNDR